MEDAIFRRDRFTCRECGAEALSVYLRADYVIDPERGGTYEDNLATFCAECYNQRNGKMIVTPLEMMQARRSQLNQLLAWKQENKRLGRDQVKIVKDYIHSRMFQDYTLNHAGDFQIEKYIRNYGLVSVLDKVDEAYFSKIKFKDDKITEESAVEFMRAIGAFLRVEQGGDLNKQIYYTGGICKNNFGEYCKKECLRRLFDYVRALEPYYSEEELILDIKGTVQQRTSAPNSCLGSRTGGRLWITTSGKCSAPKEGSSRFLIAYCTKFHIFVNGQ